MKTEHFEAYSVRQSGVVGQEIVGPEGKVVGWTIDPALAFRITSLLNGANEAGVGGGHLEYLSR